MSSRVESALGGVKTTPQQEPVRWTRFLPLVVPILIAGGFVLAQWQGLTAQLGTESTLVALALISYISASVFFLMFLIQREGLLETLAVLTTALGFGLNIAAWGTRGLITHHYPLSNLYDTALALAMTTAGASLVISAIYRQRYVGVLTLPISTMFLILAILYGNQIINMPPVLVSYWRPIHVSIAMTAYGVCAIGFALGVLYLVKDGLRTELLGLCAMLFPLLTYVFISGGNVLSQGRFTMNVLIDGSRVPLNEAGTEFLQASIPYVGGVFRLALFGSLLTVLCFAGYLYARRASLKPLGQWLLRATLLCQVVGLGWLFSQLRTTSASAVANLILPGQRALIPATWLQQFGPRLELEVRGDPVGIACLFVAVGVTAFMAVFGWQRDRIMAAVPSLPVIDNLTYKAVTVAFPLLTLMTITGAVWANESWGRYWGWDPKETWALITTLCYALFLHTRIVHGWKGRKTALFAVIGFIAVIFTYVGVSFILPGLHSYASL